MLRMYDGYEVKTIGDAFMVSFGSACTAVSFGIGVQEELLSAQWPLDYALDLASPTYAYTENSSRQLVWNGISIRVGISFGEAQGERNPITDRCDYRGRIVNLASRLEGSAPIGGVAISEACAAAVRGKLPAAELVAMPHPLDLKGLGRVPVLLAVSPKLAPRMPFYMGEAAAPHHSALQAESSRGSVTSDLARVPTFANLAAERFQARMEARSGTVAVVTDLDSGVDRDTGTDAHELLALLNAAVAKSLHSATRTKGTVGGLVGAMLQLTWNTSERCAEHARMALCFATLVGGMHSPVGIASGTVHCGSVGTQRQRFKVVAGPLTHLAHALATFDAHRSVQCLALVCHLEGSEILQEYCLPIDTWGIRSGGVVVTVTVERLYKEVSQTQLLETSMCPDDDDAHSRFRAAFTTITAQEEGSSVADAVAELQKLIKQLPEGRDVPERLEGMEAGSAYRILAPFDFCVASDVKSCSSGDFVDSCGRVSNPLSGRLRGAPITPENES
eukprot:TRINITY_DN15399_c0_g4_i1.p1 TRINITY_DN15399_c0_g4~~TRINITY_DN15399_c0_g4_i1.p1  ORF type:complete len:504 (+),score=112.53 TRINITY_DN15399_c0_g4_i1:2-1513(+)